MIHLKIFYFPASPSSTFNKSFSPDLLIPAGTPQQRLLVTTGFDAAAGP